MSCVVDASVAVKWFFANEPHAAEASALAYDDAALLAPDLVISEACNAAWKWLRLGRINRLELSEIAVSLPRFFAELVSATVLARRAVDIAAELAHPVYDCFYVALADMRDLPLVTVDTRLLAALAKSPWRNIAVHLDSYRRRA